MDQVEQACCMFVAVVVVVLVVLIAVLIAVLIVVVVAVAVLDGTKAPATNNGNKDPEWLGQETSMSSRTKTSNRCCCWDDHHPERFMMEAWKSGTGRESSRDERYTYSCEDDGQG